MTLASFGTASARTIDVQLRRNGDNGQVSFDPAYLRLQTGDKLRFVANGPDSLVGSIAGMLPDGVAPLRQKAAQRLIVSLDKDGVYGFACLPHYGDGD